jgi:hypothetical protein
MQRKRNELIVREFEKSLGEMSPQAAFRLGRSFAFQEAELILTRSKKDKRVGWNEEQRMVLVICAALMKEMARKVEAELDKFQDASAPRLPSG